MQMLQRLYSGGKIPHKILLIAIIIDALNDIRDMLIMGSRRNQ